MKSLVMRGMPMRREVTSCYILNEISALVSRISEYADYGESIGYTFKFCIDVLHPSDRVKVLAIDDIHPSAENIRSGAYPFTTSYHGVIRAGNEDATGGQLLNRMPSEEGQRCIAQAGYIP